MATEGRKLRPEEIRAALAELPGWEVVSGIRGLATNRVFATAEEAGALAATALLLGLARDRLPEVTLLGRRLRLVFPSPRRGLLTEVEVGLAQALAALEDLSPRRAGGDDRV